MRFRLLVTVLAMVVTQTVEAQDLRSSSGSSGDQTEVPRAPVALTPETLPGQTATSTAGQAGRRQSRDELGQEAGIAPMARIGGRVQNRAETRIRNRIDRYYDPQANTVSPFAVAGDQARTAGRRSR